MDEIWHRLFPADNPMISNIFVFILILLDYVVTSFSGTKHFILWSGSPFGGAGGHLLGALYLFVGGICLIFAVVCYIVNVQMIRR